MSTYIVLFKLTAQGIKNVKDSPDRAATFRKTAESMGAKVKDVYWTLGRYDGVVIFEAANDEAATSLMLSNAAMGNVQTETLRAFNDKEIREILKKVK